jgi:hypothetical protein
VRNFSFKILPKAIKGQGESMKRSLPIVDSHLLGQVLATAETQLSDPLEFFFAAMPAERTPQKSASKKKL